MTLIVSYGAGTNSVAMLCGFVERSEPVAAIVFADTGGEKPETYAHIADFSLWLVGRGYPAIQVVSNTTFVGKIPVSTLEDECLVGHRLPGIAYGFGSCAEKWKQRPFRKWLTQSMLTDPVVCIGFDADEPQRAERGASIDSGYVKRYPLIEWGWGRTECIATIKRQGVPLPGKSACFFCPSSKRAEILALPKDLQDRAIAMENNADLTTIKGLGRNYAWRDLIAFDAAQPQLLLEQPCGCYDG